MIQDINNDGARDVSDRFYKPTSIEEARSEDRTEKLVDGTSSEMLQNSPPTSSLPSGRSLALRIPLIRSIRGKLLVMLVVLSLPFLIISLLQLGSYRESLDDQVRTLAQVGTTAGAGALSAWLESHPVNVTSSGEISTAEAYDLYHRLDQHTYSIQGAVTAVLDANGHVVPNPEKPKLFPELIQPVSGISSVRWSDGISRITGVKTTPLAGWTVAVGIPANDAPVNGGYSRFVLAASWAISLVASLLLGIWAVGRFTNPLRDLAAAASTLGAGELATRASVQTDDEVGDLASSFNGMASQLQKQFNEVLAQGAFIQETLDGLPLGVAVVDCDLRIKKANPTFAGFLGRPAVEINGDGLYQAAPGLWVLEQIVADVRRTRKPYVNYSVPLSLRREVETEGEEGEATGFFDVTIWPITEQSGANGDLFIVLSEVSKRVKAEKMASFAFAAERTRAAELSSVINQMNEGVVIIDTFKRYKINVAGMRILAREPEEFRDGAEALIEDIGLCGIDELPIPVQNSPFWCALAGQESIANEQFKIRCRNGEERVLAVSAAPMKTEVGELDGAVAVFRDITEEVQRHEELVAAYARLREHDRLKSAFVSNVTHELRTPLNVILGLCQLLIRDTRMPLTVLQEDAVTRMERNARSLLELVNDLIDYSRLEAGRAALRLEWVDINELVDEVVNGFAKAAAEKGVKLEFDVAPTCQQVMTDSHKLQQVLSNLVSNAVKFTSVGSVSVFASTIDDERWSIEVRDTGIGISADALKYIFDEFRQVDDRLTRSYSGTGIGLAITRKITDLLEGKIEVRSTPGGGSVFKITLPRVIRQRTGTGSLTDARVLQMKDAKSLRSKAS